MNRIARLVGLAAVLLIVFLAAVLASGVRLRRHTEQLRQVSLQARQHQLERLLTLTHPTPPPWTDAYLNDLNVILDAKVDVIAPLSVPQTVSPTAGTWQFYHTLLADNGRPLAELRVSIQPPPAIRLGDIYRHTAMTLLVLALGLLAVLVTALLFNVQRRPEPGDQGTGSRLAMSKELDSLTHLAKTNAQQGSDLKRERDERLRADEDLNFQQILLNRSLEEKIQLGRELHDGIIQSLYATGLTFEAAKNQLARSPTEAAHQLEAGLKALNTTIRDVRSYISGLAPENLRQQSFSDSVLSLTQTLSSGRETTFDLRIDESAAAGLSSLQATDILQIISEAISNSLRHGAASKITIRLHNSAGEIGLLVQDNGNGFTPDKQTNRGHGLDNIQARADRIHATLRIISSPGEGTRTILTLPASAGKTT